MQNPDSLTWRQATDEDLWRWSWQGRGLFRKYEAPRVRVVDDLGRTIAEGTVIAYDMARQTMVLLGPGHRPGTSLWSLPAAPEQIWIAA